MPSAPYWHGDVWICPNHIPSLKLPPTTDHCWYSTCHSRQPDKPKPVVKLTVIPGENIPVPPPKYKRRGATLAMYCSECKDLIWRRPSEANRKVVCGECHKGKKPREEVKKAG